MDLTGKAVQRDLAKAWSKGVARFFAAGAVSGTMLSFELGAALAHFYGTRRTYFLDAVFVGGHCFFVEAIALDLFFYKWDKLNKWVHWKYGLILGISGVASGFLCMPPTRG